MDSVSLIALAPGEQATIVKIATHAPKARQRLLEMGLTRGTLVEIIRFAPMGDPIEVKVGSYRLSLRKVEAESVIVHKHS